MRSAPAVQVVASGAGAWPWVQAGLYGLTAGLVALWAATGLESHPPVTAGFALAAALAAAALAARALHPRPHDLRWDGAQWLLDLQATGPVAVTIDLGPWLQLRVGGLAGQPPTWVALSRRDVRGAWHGLRAALYGARPRLALPVDPAAV